MLQTLEQRIYGSTGEKVSVIGLGGACLNKGSFGDGVATVQRALELGINYFDTSPFYGKGVSQAILGEALKGRSEKYLLATKVGHLAKPARFRSPDALRTQLEENLRLLRRESVDVLQVHDADMHPWWSDDASQERRIQDDIEYDFVNAPIMQILQEAKAEGRCRFIGITGNNADKVARVLRHLDVDVCLSAFNYDLIARRTRKEATPVAREKGVALILGGVFQYGLIVEVHPEWLEFPPEWMTEARFGHPVQDVVARFERLYKLQKECGLSLVNLTIRYLLADSNITTIMVGASTPAELEESVTAAQQGPLPPDLHQAIEELGLQ